VQDYYAFGMEMPERRYNAESYRYGFNGKENDKETGWQDYGFRLYDKRICRFPSVDPLTKSYPELTPYQFASNTPVQGIDLDGLEVYYATDGTRLGQIGTNTQVRVVTQKDIKTVSGGINLANTAGGSWQKFVDTRSTALGMTEAELNTRAFMSTIKQTENHGNQALPYNSEHMKGNKMSYFTMKSYKDAPNDYKNHPYEGKEGGTAAGAYQLLRPTFKRLQKIEPKIKDFGPESQDLAVIKVFDVVGALESIKKGDIDKAIAPLIKDQWGNTQFASLPGGGQEAAGMSIDKVKTMFKQNLVKELNNKSDVATPKGKLLH
jgi:RHS repeat-associated protein